MVYTTQSWKIHKNRGSSCCAKIRGSPESPKLSDAFRDHRSFPQQNEGLFRRDATTLGPVLKCDPQGDPVPMCDGCHCPTHLIFFGGRIFHRYI